MIKTRSIVKLESKIFDKTVRGQKVEKFVRGEARDYKVLTKRRIVEGPQTGRLYARKRGESFRRFHRASAKGQRPAIDSGKLLNSIADKATSRTTADVPATATNKGFDYPGELQEKMDRPIESERDAQQAEAKMLKDSNAMLRELI